MTTIDQLIDTFFASGVWAPELVDWAEASLPRDPESREIELKYRQLGALIADDGVDHSDEIRSISTSIHYSTNSPATSERSSPSTVCFCCEQDSDEDSLTEDESVDEDVRESILFYEDSDWVQAKMDLLAYYSELFPSDDEPDQEELDREEWLESRYDYD